MQATRQALCGVSRRVLTEWAAVAVIATLLVAILAGFSLTSRADNLIHDVATRLFPRPASPDILVVAIDDASLAQLGAWPWPRERHAALIRRLGEAEPRAVLYDVLFTEEAADPAQDAALATAMAGTKVYLPVLAGPATIPPVPVLAAKAAGTGAANVYLDADGLVRRAAFGTVLAPPLAWVLASDLTGSLSPAPTSPPLIRFADPKAGYATVSFASALAGEVPDSFLKGRLVLVGATAAGLGERFPTPLSGGAANMPGVELQANVIDNLLSGRLVEDAPRAAVIAVCILPLWLLLAAFLAAPPRWTLVLGAGLALLLLGASLAGYGLGLWLPPASGLAGLALVFPLWGWRRLAATSDGLALELARLKARLAGSEATVVSGEGGGDVLARQMEDIRLAIEQVDDLRRFAADALFSLPDATLVLDPERRVLAANGAARALFGGAVRGKIASELIAGLSPRQGPELEVWPPRQAAPPVELILADDRVFEMQSVWRLDDDDAPAGWIVRLADVTLLKSALRHREQALQLLTHDMRSPQTSILALLQNAPDQTVEAGLGERIATYARRTLALADGFVRLARAEDARPCLEEINISDVLMEAADELWPQSRQRGMTISQSGLDEPRWVRGDRGILTRIFVNLLSNAVKYGPEGSTIRLSAVATDRGVEVEVADEGPGFTAEEQVVLFSAFSAFERPQAQTDGVGLGLAFVRTAVIRQGGQVALRSAPGEGAVFVVSLPAA